MKTEVFKSVFDFHFYGILENASSNMFVSGIIQVPQHILSQLTKENRIRVSGRFQQELAFNLAIQNKKSGERYLCLNASSIKSLKLKVGESILVEFSIADPNHLVIPEEFAEVILQDELGRQIFESFTVGYRRSILHYVSSAKSSDTRIKRSIEMIEKAKMGNFEMQKRNKSK